MHQVLVVEDQIDIRRVLRVLLESASYRVVEADTAARGVIEARSHKPDLVLVDLGLPDRDGVELIRDVRQFSPVPIIVLSARVAEDQKIEALDAGADDYVTKPFGAAELLARVRAALRRNVRTNEGAHVLHFSGTSVELAKRVARNATGEVHFTPLEYRVIECLARNLGGIVMQDQLIREVWGPDRLGDSRSLRVCIRQLRQKLELDPHEPRHLVTETGVGYRLRVDEDLELRSHSGNA